MNTIFNLLITTGSVYAEKTQQRFWSKVNKQVSCLCHQIDDACWLWEGNTNKQTGYGQFGLREYSNKWHSMGAHRFAYQSTHELLSSDVFVLHTPPCVTKLCMRHLYAGTRQDNTKDAILMERFASGDRHGLRLHPEAAARGIHNGNSTHPESRPRGEQHLSTKLSDNAVAMLRAEWATGTRRVCDLATQFGIHVTYASRILHGHARQGD